MEGKRDAALGQRMEGLDIFGLAGVEDTALGGKDVFVVRRRHTFTPRGL